MLVDQEALEQDFLYFLRISLANNNSIVAPCSPITAP
jgi:hypothetical protein